MLPKLIISLLFDESKTHLILSPFFMNILRLNVEFKFQIIEYSPKFVFCKNLEKKKKQKTNNKSSKNWLRQKCRDIISVCHDINSSQPVEVCRNNKILVAT